ncbi:alpha/beta fold hydrolase [Flavobacterium sp.]|uniref:alpha/beta fold hydrolase n=1 Tax=Flavobacterium sp. TaxID=239 RepID=UPI002B4B951C|nr:alpha/beta fold hydrolase [Flavobacterium sp.]HLF52938.1 alpha/beta fold hydrolase [Flavobacterium sp.]
MKKLEKIILSHFVTENGKILKGFPLFFQVFGQPIGKAPIVLVNHALTGNSEVTGENGWWKELIGANQTIDANEFTIIAFNIPGNGFDGVKENLIYNYTHFTARDIAKIFWKGLQELGIEKLFAVIGGSLGGGIAWEMAVLNPIGIENLIPIASDWKATDWVIANTLVQDEILNNSNYPIPTARAHAMLLYRTPQSLKQKFGRQKNELKNIFQVESWLFHHGDKLQKRFQLSAYKMMNHLIKTIDITRNRKDFVTVAKVIQSNIHIIAVDTDHFFTADENRETYKDLKKVKQNVFYHEIKSIHGHDAFLIEYEQLNTILNNLFITTKQTA